MRWLIITCLFVLSSQVWGQTPARSLAEGEYFWDTDPGQGLATAFLAKDGAYDSAIETLFTGGIALPAGSGAHTLNVRVKAVDGVWSSLFTTVVHVFADSAQTVQQLRNMEVIQGEYFWDVDPGEGSATPLLALDGSWNETLETVFANGITTPAAAGPHSFNMRVKSTDGTWSSVFTTVVDLANDPVEVVQGLRDMAVIQAEYFWDTDPGEGSGSPLLALDGALDETLETIFKDGIPTPAVVGPHTFNVRVKDIDGTWSGVFSTVVDLGSDPTEVIQALRDMAVIQAEYFWDTDPGEGSGSALLALDGALDETLETAFKNGIATPATLGSHTFNVRVKDIDGTWSSVFTTIVYVQIDPTVVVNGLRDMEITQAEYYWDTDPGQGSGTPLLAFDGALDETLETLFAAGIATPATAGAHTFNVRVKDIDGNWSSDFSSVVELTDPATTVTGLRDMEIIQAEYFWNADPGVGGGTPILAFDGALDETLETLFAAGIPTPATAGAHTFNVRVKDVDGNWSTAFTTIVTLSNPGQTVTGLRKMEIVQGEFFWNVDPGIGAASPLLAVDGGLNETLEAMFQYGIPTPGSYGPHSFNVRVRDIDGNWGPLFKTIVHLGGVGPGQNNTGYQNDNDGDSLSELMEYFLGTDPETFDNYDDHIKSTFEQFPGGSGDEFLTIEIDRRAAAAGAELEVEISNDLTNWHTSADGWVEQLEETATRLRFRATRSTTSEPRLFYRFKVTLAAP